MQDEPLTPGWKRNESRLLDDSLQNFTLVWLKALPDAVRPFKCARHYPRVLNKLAAIWSLNDRCIEFLDELMLDRRGNRQGFGHGVPSELRRLRSHRLAMMPQRDPAPTDFLPTVPMAMEWPPSKR